MQCQGHHSRQVIQGHACDDWVVDGDFAVERLRQELLPEMPKLGPGRTKQRLELVGILSQNMYPPRRQDRMADLFAWELADEAPEVALAKKQLHEAIVAVLTSTQTRQPLNHRVLEAIMGPCY